MSAGNVGRRLCDSAGNLFLVFWHTGTVPSSVAGYAVGCILIDAANGSDITDMIRVNTGTAASCTFTALDGTGH